MADGTVDLGRAMTIAARTTALTDADAAYADEILAAAAPGLRPDQLARKAAALEMKLAPEAVRARKQLARELGQRVEARREESGNASLAGRELDTADVIASKAYIDAVAVRLRDSGQFAASLPRLRALALLDLTQGRNPLDRLEPAPGPAPPAAPPSAANGPGAAPAADTTTQPSPALPGEETPGQDSPGENRPGQAPVPLPALINLVAPAPARLGYRPRPRRRRGC